MARIRSIHPGQWVDEHFVQMTFQGRLFAIALRNFADDRGVFEWKPFMLKMQIFAADSLDVDQLLAELLTFQQIAKFEHEGRSYGAIRNFVKWQRARDPKPVHPLPAEMEKFVGIGADEIEKFISLRTELCNEQEGGCFYCGTQITHYSKRFNSLEIDHKTPKSRGGSDDRENLVAACRPCNRSKGSMTADEFMAQLDGRRGKASAKDAAWHATNEASHATGARRIRENSRDKTDVGDTRYEEGGSTKPSADAEGLSPPPAGTPALPLLPDEHADAPPPPPRETVPLQWAIDEWNRLCPPRLPGVQTLTDKRRSHLRARLIEHFRPDYHAGWTAYLHRILASDFLSGRVPGKSWRADFDYAVRADACARILEGRFDNEQRGQPSTSTVSPGTV